jgi:hypothetical protein
MRRELGRRLVISLALAPMCAATGCGDEPKDRKRRAAGAAAPRIAVGGATFAVPSGWRRAAGERDASSVTLVRAGSGALPTLIVAKDEDTTAPPGTTSFAQRRSDAALISRLRPGMRLLPDDTTVDGARAFVVAGFTSASGRLRQISAPRDSSIYQLAVSDLDTIDDTDLAALETVRSTWRWK